MAVVNTVMNLLDALIQGKQLEQLMNCDLSTEDRGADKSLARPGRKQAAPVKSVMGRGMD